MSSGIDAPETDRRDRQPARGDRLDDPARDGRLAEERDRRIAPGQRLEEAHHHPLGDVEVALAGDGIETAEARPVLLSRGVRRAERSELGARHPGWIAEDEQRPGQRGELALPGHLEEVARHDTLARMPGKRGARGSRVVCIDLVAHQRRAWKALRRGGQERPLPTGRLQHGAPGGAEPSSDDEVEHGVGERARRLPVASLDACSGARHQPATLAMRRTASSRRLRVVAMLSRANPAPSAPKLGPDESATFPRSRNAAAGSAPSPSAEQSSQAR